MSLPNEAVDHVARAAADRAHDRINSHERHCAERWELSRTAMNEVKAAIAGIFRRLWWIVGLILAADGALILFLANRLFP